MEKNDTPKSFVSGKALKCMIRLSGLQQDFVAKKVGISPIYLSYILSDKRRAEKKRQEIFAFVSEIKIVVERYAA